MFTTRHAVAVLIDRFARLLALDLTSGPVIDSLDEHEVIEQLQYGRD